MVIARLNRFNQRHPWSHNDHYGRWVTAQVARSGARHVLDVGCGTGNLVDRLRGHGATVTGLEPDPATAGVAAERFAADPSVTIMGTDFAGRDPRRRWDAITLVAVLHHMPLVPTLRELRESLSPGGRLVVVGCYRDDRVTAQLPAVLANPVVGLVKHPSRAATTPVHMTAPTAAPQESLAQVRAAVARELPGARIRRRLFWRYTLTWTAPVRGQNPIGSPA